MDLAGAFAFETAAGLMVEFVSEGLDGRRHQGIRGGTEETFGELRFQSRMLRSMAPL